MIHFYDCHTHHAYGPCHGRLHVTCSVRACSHISCIVTSQFSHSFVVVVTDWSRSLIAKAILNIVFLYNLGRDHCKCCSESRRPRLELWLLQSLDQKGGKLTLPCLYFYEYGEQIASGRKRILWGIIIGRCHIYQISDIPSLRVRLQVPNNRKNRVETRYRHFTNFGFKLVLQDETTLSWDYILGTSLTHSMFLDGTSQQQ